MKFRVYPKDRLPIHAHAKIGGGEVIVEVRRGRKVALSTVHKEAVIGPVKDSEIVRVLRAAADVAAEIRAEWKEMRK